MAEGTKEGLAGAEKLGRPDDVTSGIKSGLGYRKRPRAGSLWVDSLALSSIPSFHNLRLRISYRLFAVFVRCVFQHCTGGLCSGAAEIAIELGDALGMWAVKTDEDHTARVFCNPVHDAEHTTAFPARCES